MTDLSIQGLSWGRREAERDRDLRIFPGVAMLPRA